MQLVVYHAGVWVAGGILRKSLELKLISFALFGQSLLTGPLQYADVRKAVNQHTQVPLPIQGMPDCVVKRTTDALAECRAFQRWQCPQFLFPQAPLTRHFPT